MQPPSPRATALALVLAGTSAAQAPQPSPPPPERAQARALLALDATESQHAWLREHADAVTQEFVRQLIAAGHAEADASRLERGDRAVELVRELADAGGFAIEGARSYCLAGRLAMQRGDFEAAESASLDCKQRLDALTSGVDAWRAEPLRNLGYLEMERGRFEESIAWGLQAVAADERGGTERNLGRSLQNLGIAYSYRGDFALAMEAFARALEIQQRLGNQALVGNLLNELAIIHSYQNQPEIALDYFQRALDIAARSGSPRDHAIGLMNVSVMLKDQKRYDEALGLLQQAREIDQQAGMRGELAKALKQVGSTLVARGDLAGALATLDETIALSQEVHAEPVLINALNERANALLRLARPAEAQAAAERAAGLADTAGSLLQLREAKGYLAQAREALGDADGALSAWREAIDCTERLRERVAGGEEERQGFFGMHIQPYREALRLELGRGRTAEALRIAETARARTLLDVLKIGRVRPATFLSASEREQERRAEERLAHLQPQERPGRAGQLGGSPSPDHELLEAREALADLRARLYASHPELRLLRGDTAPITPETIAERLLDERTAVLLFSVSPARSHLMVLTRTGAGAAPRLSAYTLEISAEALAARVSRFRERLEARDLDLSDEARGLYDLLLGPARAELAGRTRLLIAPDGILWELPFQALQPRPARYLLQDADLSYAPSLTALVALADRPRHAGPADPELLAFGDPLYAPGNGFAPLPQTARQVRALATLLGAKRSRVHLGAEAREDLFKREAVAARLVHVTAHGVLDGVNPMSSYLALASEPKGAAEDGRLEARELLQLDLDADLVVLSACETARGRVADGEGVVGLAWATLLAGARSVVVSQWRVDAASTDLLMLGFYRRLEAQRRKGAGADVAVALRGAALALLADPGTRHPYFWAGFIPIGVTRLGR